MTARATMPSLDAADVAAILNARRFVFTSERELQDGIADALTAAGVAFEREAILWPDSRVDFLVGAVALEVKIDGVASSVLQQLHRYALAPHVQAVVLVTARSTLRAVPSILAGKPCRSVYVSPL